MTLVTSFELIQNKRDVIKLATNLGYKTSDLISNYAHYTNSLLFNPELKQLSYKSRFIYPTERRQVRNINFESTYTPIVHLHVFIKALLSYVNHI